MAECSTAPDSVTGGSAVRWARLLRRARRHQEAADVRRRLASSRTVRAVLRAEAQEALAVHHEHRDRDLEKAHQWATGALISGVGARHRTAVTHRLARLRQKITGTKRKRSGDRFLPYPGRASGQAYALASAAGLVSRALRAATVCAP